MVRKLRTFAALFVLPWLLVVGFGASYVGASPAQAQVSGPQTFNVLAGNPISTDSSGKPTWQGQNFYPGAVTINVGDSVHWKLNSGIEPHTVTFLGPDTLPEQIITDTSGSPGGPPTLLLNPKIFYPAGGPTFDGSAFTNSGFMESDVPGTPQELTLTFTKPGTYTYLCLLHGNVVNGQIVGMHGTITVQAAGSAYPMTPDQVVAAGQQEIAADAALAKQDEAGLAAMVPANEQMADGSTKHHVVVGSMDMSRNLEYQRFIPSEIQVNAGDTIEWSETMPGFHTVTFGQEPAPFQPQPQPQGPPKIVLNPLAFLPQGPNVYTGDTSTLYSSGILAAPGSPPEAGIQNYDLKFTAAGTFEFICIPHDANGMNGHVTVMALGGTPGMPRTGNGDNESLWLLFSAAGSLLLVLSGITLKLKLRPAKNR